MGLGHACSTPTITAFCFAVRGHLNWFGCDCQPYPTCTPPCSGTWTVLAQWGGAGVSQYTGGGGGISRPVKFVWENLHFKLAAKFPT